MKPIIGITCLHDIKEDRMRQNHTYIQAVKKAGGIPFLLPCVAEEDLIMGMLQAIDGLIVSGGPDMHPRYFGEEPHLHLGGVAPLMDTFEIQLIKKAVAIQLPLLGICRGEQSLNIAMGGTVFQDINSQLNDILQHRQDSPREFPSHSIKVKAKSKLAGILGKTELLVNTFHHQAVNKVAPGFVAVAHASDGIIEAIEAIDDNLFAIGVQWHPEGMWNAEYNYDNLFAALVEKASN